LGLGAGVLHQVFLGLYRRRYSHRFGGRLNRFLLAQHGFYFFANRRRISARRCGGTGLA
jgi:hypothetical protein